MSEKKQNTVEPNLEPSDIETGAEQEEVEVEETVDVDERAAELKKLLDAAVEQALKAQADDFQQKLLRLQADFDNFRRRTRQEKEDAAKYAAQPVITKLLPALDNLERAIVASGQSKDFDVFAKGVEMTTKLLIDGLQQEGLQLMQTVGEIFNPEYHQAVMQIESDEYADGEIVEELQKGYMLKDKVIRPAMVKVNKG